jgi:hypothetical protein
MCGRCRCLYVIDDSNNLYTLDPVTASTHLVGTINVAGSVTDIAFHGPTLYGISASQFLRIDPETGKGTVIGPIGGGFGPNGLAVASDGTIYAGSSGQLIRINPVTGAGTLVGNFGGGLSSSGDLAFDCNDVLYGALNQGASVALTQINLATGAATVIGSTGQSFVFGLDFFCCHLYGVTGGGQLLTINAASGASTVIGKNGLDMYGLAVKPCCGC